MDTQRSVRRWGALFPIALVIFLTAGGAGAQGTSARGEKAPSPVVIEVSPDRFDWQDAGVGAAASLALVAIGGGLTLVVRSRPPSRDHPGGRAGAIAMTGHGPAKEEQR